MKHKNLYLKDVLVLFLFILLLFLILNIRFEKNNKSKKKLSIQQNTVISLLKLENNDNPRIRVLLTNKNGGIYWEEDDLSAIDNATVPPSDMNNTEEQTKESVYYIYNDPEEVLEIHYSKQGIYLINELPLEEYLKGVVPSEMPAFYPKEALKAQAVCARTYAYKCLLNPGYPEFNADLDDSCNFQVYHKNQSYSETEEAIKETQGIYLCNEDKNLYDVYYYSTSWGKGADVSIWNTGDMNHDISDVSEEALETNPFKITDQNDPEFNEKYYRWEYQITDINTSELKSLLMDLYNSKKSDIITEKNNIWDDLIIQNIYVCERGSGLSVIRLCLETNQGKILILGENSIRKVIGAMSGTLLLNDDSKREDIEMLPSSYFTIEKAKESPYKYIVFGGGYGHGIGMSQNGAKNLALQGYNYKEILKQYFPLGYITE